MKIAVFDFFTNPGGVTAVLSKILPRMEEMGHIVVFIDPLPHSFPKDLGVPSYFLPVWPSWSVISSTNKLKYIFKIILSSLAYAGFAIKLSNHLKIGKYNILYLHLKKGVYVGWLAAKIARIPFVIHAHGFNNAKDITFLYKIALKSADCVISVSQDVLITLLEVGIDENKIVNIYNSIDMTSWKEKIKYSKPKDIFTIIFVGAIQQTKGVHNLIIAVKQLVNQGINAQLNIVGEIPLGGDKSYLRYLENEVYRLDLQENVSFLGRRDDIPQIMSEADVLVLPSIVKESFGMVLIEAAASGILVLGSKIGGIPEVISDEDLLFAPNDIERLVSLLSKVFKNPDWRDAKTRAFVQHVESNFDLNTQVEKILRVFTTYAQ